MCRRGHPVLVHRRLVAELQKLPATGQARDVIRRHRPETRYVPVEDPGVLRDIDTPDDYASLQPDPPHGAGGL